MNLMTPSTVSHILLVEDNPADIQLMEEALAEGRGSHFLHGVKDGDKAIRFLQKEEPYTESQRPDIIILDLNLPGTNGREVLATIKRDNDLKRIPVVVFTSSNAEKDVNSVYSSYGNCFVKKPKDFDQFVNVVKQIEDYWLNTVILPPPMDD